MKAVSSKRRWKEREGPPHGVDEQSQIAEVANDPIDATRDQRVSGLEGDQPAAPLSGCG